MDPSPKVIRSNPVYRNLILFGGLGCVVVGLYLLAHPFALDEEGDPYWLMGSLFLPFGLWGLFSVFDMWSITVYSDRIEMKSFFRKRQILKSEVIGYGVEEYEGESISGERIRVITHHSSTKFHTTQFDDLSAIKQFLKGKEQIKGAFKRERIADFVAIGLALILACTPLLFDKDREGAPPSMAIQAKINEDLKVMAEDNQQIRFTLKGYENYTFLVDKEHVPNDFKTSGGTFVVVIYDTATAQELSKKQAAKPTVKTVEVDEIRKLE